ncbi:T9SS-dependent choice-of-anchor J family protein [Lacinutrix sp. 5H-3-7-4]|uniref:T9SS-dependent choice-of-anchor J family protein n=1 Tax=Lacinutrix sp. (strain 5H-3-7-4) TaxID=983544 RepID=UPI00020A3DE9|nr:choice-of-anchor J domain-containing protein [Lacinutrix sp. 5H-3-7-4]AEH00612.1 Cleaved adhesin domain protein [Lacinutrix sp. 5H-3-7-4]
MKKITFLLLLATVSFSANLFGQQKTPIQNTKRSIQQQIPAFEPTKETQNSLEQTGYARCLTDENEIALQKQYPSRVNSAEFEAWIAPKLAQYKADRAAGKTMPPVFNIPVVIHIIHNGDPINTNGLPGNENISDAQALSQIQVMNEDYRRLANTPGGANTTGLAQDIEINFCIAQQDPFGSPTTGIVRHNITPPSNTSAATDDWETRADTENMKTTTQWDPEMYLNMWTIKAGGLPINQGGQQGLLGYAQFPSNSGLAGINTNGGAANTDGVVASYDAMGTLAENDGSFILNNQYNLGRTMTHEVGHWLGLRHIWGDGDCSADDFCADTPISGNPNYTCNLSADSCPTSAGNDQVQNYMDYTNDACMDTFTQDQKDRMVIVMQNSPRRMQLNTSNTCSPASPTVNYTTTAPNSVIEGSDCGFQDFTFQLSISSPTTATTTANLISTGSATINEDFDLLNNSVVFNAGTGFPSGNDTITLRVYNDSFVETDEDITLEVNVTTTGDAIASTTPFTLTLVNDDIAATGSANTTIFTQDWEDTTGWTIIDSDGDGENWGVFQPLTFGNLSGNWAGSVTDQSVVGGTGVLTPDNYIISPAITIGSSATSVEFNYEIGAAGTPEHFAVYFTTDITDESTIIAGTLLEETNTIGGTTENRSVITSDSNIVGQTGHLVFRHFNTTGNSLIMLDTINIIESINFVVQTEENIANPSTINVNTTGTAYSFDNATGNIVAGLDNTGGFDYGCTTITVTRDQTIAGAPTVLRPGSTANEDRVMAKTISFTPENTNTSGQTTLSFYFTNAEITAWETITGESRNNLFAFREGTNVSEPVTVSDFNGDYILTVPFTSGIDGNYYFGRQFNLSTPSFDLENSVSIFPNPTRNSLTISSKNNEIPSEYSVYNMLGQLITNKKINTEADLTLNTSALSNGVYFIKIAKDNAAITLRFIKE